MRDYYKILGVHQNADQQTIMRAYRDLLKTYHPDRNPGFVAQANAKAAEINEAYEALSDPQQRRNYDLDLNQQRHWGSGNGTKSSRRAEEETHRRAEEEARRQQHDGGDYLHLKHAPQTSFQGILRILAEKARNNTEKGRVFEKLVESFVREEAAQSERFSNVWLWDDYPKKNGRADFGVDLVAEERDNGGVIAIQCKFYASSRRINRKDVDPFLSATGMNEFSGGIFVSTTEWNKNAEDALQGRDKPIERWGVQVFEDSSINWERYSLTAPGQMTWREGFHYPQRKEGSHSQENSHTTSEPTGTYTTAQQYQWEIDIGWCSFFSYLFFIDTDERYIADGWWRRPPRSEHFQSHFRFAVFFVAWMTCSGTIAFIRLASTPLAWIVIGGLAIAFGALTTVILGWFGIVLMVIGGGLVSALYPRLSEVTNSFPLLVIMIAGAVAFLAGAASVVSVALTPVFILVLGVIATCTGVTVGRRRGSYTIPLLLTSDDEFI